MKQDMTRFIEDREGMVLYSDPIAHVILPEQPVTHGHIRIFSKEPVTSIEELPDEHVEHLFTVANTAASMLFELKEPGGTNILVNEGDLFDEHFHIDVLTREEGDNVATDWEPKDIPEATMDDIADRIGSALLNPSTGREETETIQTDSDADESMSTDEENYLLKKLNKLP